MRVGVILFRAQPFHNGHLEMVKKAYEENDKVYIFVGSADKSGTKRNPLPIDFRVELIRHSLQERGWGWQGLACNTIHIVPLNDLTNESDNSHEWGEYLYNKIVDYTGQKYFTMYYSDKPEIMLSWFDDDISKNYISFKFLERNNDISATKVRLWIENDISYVNNIIPSYVLLNKAKIKEYLLAAK